MTYAQLFYLEDAGQGRWLVRHQITDLIAGRVVRTTQGYLLTDEESHTIGTFPDINSALRGLYALV